MKGFMWALSEGFLWASIGVFLNVISIFYGFFIITEPIPKHLQNKWEFWILPIVLFVIGFYRVAKEE